jgi:hypothetical protein
VRESTSAETAVKVVAMRFMKGSPGDSARMGKKTPALQPPTCSNNANHDAIALAAIAL